MGKYRRKNNSFRWIQSITDLIDEQSGSNIEHSMSVANVGLRPRIWSLVETLLLGLFFKKQSQKSAKLRCYSRKVPNSHARIDLLTSSIRRISKSFYCIKSQIPRLDMLNELDKSDYRVEWIRLRDWIDWRIELNRLDRLKKSLKRPEQKYPEYHQETIAKIYSQSLLIILNNWQKGRERNSINFWQ